MAGSQLRIDDFTPSFEEVAAIQVVKNLTPNQVNIVRFLERGYYQSYIADRLHLTRQYINKTVRLLEAHKLIIPNEISFDWQTRRNGAVQTVRKTIATSDPLHGRAKTYKITAQLKSLLDVHPFKEGSFTLFTPHHQKYKYPVLARKSALDTEAWKRTRVRSIYIKSWYPKGRECHLWHINTQHGTIGVEYHGKSIIAYRIEKSNVMAESIEEADQMIAAFVHEGVLIWTGEQNASAAGIQLGSPKLITTTHYATESKEMKKLMEDGKTLNVPGMFSDNSPEEQGNPEVGHIETTNRAVADVVDRGLRNAANIENIVQREVETAMKGANQQFAREIAAMLDPLHQEIGVVQAHVQGGSTLQHKFNELVTLLTISMKQREEDRDQIAALRKEIESLKAEKPVKAPE